VVATSIIALSADTPTDTETLGGKGCGLVRLLRAGLPVPEPWCLPANTTQTDDSLDGELKRWWERHAQRGDCFAVRSSATAEDQADASFAGIYSTSLAVNSAAELRLAVQRCRSSIHSAAARAYRAKRELDTAPRMAVLIQRMVSARVSAVMLTANPLRPFASEIAIEASWGLGESLAAGNVEPDRYVLDRGSGALRSKQVGSKQTEVVPTRAGGTELQRVDEERADRPCLGQAELAQLFALALLVERSIGPQQDLELAFDDKQLWVLQQRPIVGLPPSDPTVVWTRKFGDEYLADYTLPLSYTLLVRWIEQDYLRDLAELSGQADLAEMQPLRRHNGYAYLSGAYLARLLRAVPASMRDRGLPDWFTPLWQRRMEREPFEPRRLWGLIRAHQRDPRAGLSQNEDALSAHCERIDRTILPKIRQRYEALSLAQWSEQFEQVYALGQEHFRIIRWGMGMHAPMLHGLLRALLIRWADDVSGDLYQALIGGLSDTKTALINRDIWRMAALAREDDALRGHVLALDLDPEAIRQAAPHQRFWSAFDEFLDTHGHRAGSREISAPRWREQPELVLGFIRAQLLPQQQPPDPAERANQAFEQRQHAQRRARQRAGRGLGGWLRRRVLGQLCTLTERYTRYRENQRYHLDYLLTHLRKLLLCLGERFTSEGVLEAAADIFYLEADELRGLLNEGASPNASELRIRIEERRSHHQRHRLRLPASYLFDDIETEGEIVEGDANVARDSAQSDLIGIGACRGVAQGPARVVRHAKELAEIRQGDVLVTSNIDPGWTHVFPMLAGIVTETGGTLSHGALLAREYGIAAVMSVPGATSRFRTGTPLWLDGTTGQVRVTTPLASKPSGSATGQHS